jgi:hypothetical protein
VFYTRSSRCGRPGHEPVARGHGGSPDRRRAQGRRVIPGQVPSTDTTPDPPIAPPLRARALVTGAVAASLVMVVAACAGSQILGADPSGTCPPGLRPHHSEGGVAECVSAAAADFALCVHELGLSTPRPAVSVHAVMTFPTANTAPTSNATVTAPSNGQINAQTDVETDRARADAMRACMHAFQNAVTPHAAAVAAPATSADPKR